MTRSTNTDAIDKLKGAIADLKDDITDLEANITGLKVATDKLKCVSKEEEKAIEKLIADIKEKKGAIDKLKGNSEKEENAINKLITDIEELKAKNTKQIISAMSKVATEYKTLSPEQRASLQLLPVIEDIADGIKLADPLIKRYDQQTKLQLAQMFNGWLLVVCCLPLAVPAPALAAITAPTLAAITAPTLAAITISAPALLAIGMLAMLVIYTAHDKARFTNWLSDLLKPILTIENLPASRLVENRHPDPKDSVKFGLSTGAAFIAIVTVGLLATSSFSLPVLGYLCLLSLQVGFASGAAHYSASQPSITLSMR